MTSDAKSVPESLVDSRYGLYRFNDDSFSALGIRAGDCAVVRHRPVTSGTLSAVLTPDCGPLLRIACFERAMVRLRALNPLFRDHWYTPSQISILGAVEKVIPQNNSATRFPSEVSTGRHPFIKWAADDRGRIVDVSESLGLATGQDHRQFLQDGWARFVHPEQRQGIVAAWYRALENGERLSERFHFRSLLGGYMRVHSRARPILSETGKIDHWEGSVTISALTTDELTGRFFYPKQAAS